MPEDPTDADAELPVWEETAALAAVAGDASLARELLAALIAGLPADLAALKATGGDDAAALAAIAQHMRGATRYCGVVALDAALEDLDRAARAGAAAGMAAALAKIEVEATRLTEDYG